MKELYLVYVGGGQYEDYYESVRATFDTQEEAEKWAADNILEIKDWRNLTGLYEEWCDKHPEYDDDTELAETEFLKEHPEYTAADLERMWHDVYFGNDEIVTVYRLTPGVPAEMKSVSNSYIYNPNRDKERPPRHWIRLE